MNGKIVAVSSISMEIKQIMFRLMDEFYDNMTWENFIKDLSEKDHCILLFDETETLRGFSTQKLMQLEIDGKVVSGLFSGDTIIHRDYWGSMALFKVFARTFFSDDFPKENFYWFLISKGYKTYKMLPIFFNEFYPNCSAITPAFEQKVMNTFGRTKYPGEYNEKTGVIEYTGIKDKLKSGVADITEKLSEDEHIRFFIERNPDYFNGNDLVCIASLNKDNLKKSVRRTLGVKELPSF